MATEDWTEELTGLVQKLVSIETENPPGNERECSEYVVEWFTERGVDAELVPDPYEDRPQAVATIGEGDPTVVLNGHVDVVPAGDHSQWEHDPYGAEIEDGTLYGRGAADMKSGLAVGMVAAVLLGDRIDASELDGSVIVHAAVDEETAGPGTKRLLELGCDGDYGVVLEPTGFRTATREKGHAWYEITVSGESTHGGTPNEGVNAVLGLHHVIDALTDYDRRVRQREDDLVGCAYATVTSTQSASTSSVNTVPETARLTLDRRMVPRESSEDVDEEVDDILAGVEQAYSIETDWQHTTAVAGSSRVDDDCKVARTLRHHSNDVVGTSTASYGFSGTSDLRNLVNDAGMEAVTWGPASPHQSHTVDEHVELEDIQHGVDILVRSVADLMSE